MLNVKITFGDVEATLISIVEEESTDNDPLYRVSFDVPAGQGSNVEVRAWLGSQESQAIKISYPAPKIRDSTPAQVSTNGSIVEVNGVHFGTYPEMQAVVRNTNGECTTFASGELLTLNMISYTHTNIVFESPVGDGRCKFGLIVQAGNQNSCDVNANDCTQFYFEYASPRINFVETPAEKPTIGGYRIRLVGVNFGGVSATVKVHLGVGSSTILGNSGDNVIASSAKNECAYENHTHFEIFCVVPAGEGKKLSIFVDVSNAKYN